MFAFNSVVIVVFVIGFCDFVVICCFGFLGLGVLRCFCGFWLCCDGWLCCLAFVLICWLVFLFLLLMVVFAWLVGCS